jgi:vacuolar-type H+-ATPase subunit I/STV1
MPEKTRTAPGPLPGSPEVANISQEDSSIPEKINLSVDEERRRLQEEHQRLREENRQKEAELKELEDESISTLNDAFDVLQRFSDVIEADNFIEDSRLRIDRARPDERTRTILDVLRSTSVLIDVVGSKRWGQ